MEEKNKIIDIKNVNDNSKICTITYDVMGLPKDVIVKKNSKQLEECINKYICVLNRREKKVLLEKNDDLFLKRVTLIAILIIGGLLCIYLIMSLTINANAFIRFVGYVSCLTIIGGFYIYARNVTYCPNKKIENSLKDIQKEIKRVTNMKKDCANLK